MQAELVLDACNAVGESPVWLAAEGALYWSDIPARRLLRWREDGSVTRWELPEMAGCIAPHVQGGWVAAMETGVFHLRLPEQGGAAQVTRIATVRHAGPGMRFNDGRCDRQGRLRAGTMVMDMSLARADGVLYGLDERGLEVIEAGFLTPNGMAFSPDGRTLYLSDSHPQSQQVWAYDYDVATGVASGKRSFVDMRPLPGRPDGAAVDEDGCYWVCGNDAGLVHRFTPRGELDRSLPVPVAKPAMCAFGGAGLDTLFVTSIRPAGDVSGQPLAGGVFALRPGVRGLPEPACSLSLSITPTQETP
jgi:sugar lactone lactonase YvrE